jgi:Domain of unknown function (DUF4145)
MTPYTAPQLRLSSFNCPHCNAYAAQLWSSVAATPEYAGSVYTPRGMMLGNCQHCHKYTFWYGDNLIYPYLSSAPLPNPDLPQDVQDDYEEARTILNKSPRGAAALLRLCVQKLYKDLGESGSNINDDIANLVKKGLSTLIRDALDSVRVIGNEAVHPGQMDLKDDRETALKLFKLINLVADRMITEPRLIQDVYATLPQSKVEAIEQRDKSS